MLGGNPGAPCTIRLACRAAVALLFVKPDLMILATASTEPMPTSLALLVVVLAAVGGCYALLTGFHAKWRKTLHWERFKKGPVLSQWSNATAGALCLIGPTAMLSDSFGLPDWLTIVLRILAGTASALMIGGMIYDLLASWL